MNSLAEKIGWKDILQTVGHLCSAHTDEAFCSFVTQICFCDDPRKRHKLRGTFSVFICSPKSDADLIPADVTAMFVSH